MSGRIVVGSAANESGADALGLATRIAAAGEALLDVVMVVSGGALRKRPARFRGMVLSRETAEH